MESCTAASCSTSSQPNARGGRQSGSHVLVAYYSATGHTADVAKAIADAADGDLFELTPEREYSSGDLNWNDEFSRVNSEHNDESLRDVPLNVTSPDGWDKYDTVFIGYPIWWGGAVWPVNHFVTDNDFTGEKVIPFATSASSPLGSSGSDFGGYGGSWRLAGWSEVLVQRIGRRSDFLGGGSRPLTQLYMADLRGCPVLSVIYRRDTWRRGAKSAIYKADTATCGFSFGLFP